MPFRKLLLLSSALMLLLTGAAFAQDNIGQSRDVVVPARRLERQQRRQRMRQQRLFRLREQLDLSDVQRQQLRELRHNRLDSTKSAREELFGLREKRRAGTFTEADKTRAHELRLDLRQSLKGMRSDVQNILTPEQRMKIEGLRKTRRERRQRIREFRRSL